MDTRYLPFQLLLLAAEVQTAMCNTYKVVRTTMSVHISCPTQSQWPHINNTITVYKSADREIEQLILLNIVPMGREGQRDAPLLQSPAPAGSCSLPLEALPSD